MNGESIFKIVLDGCADKAAVLDVGRDVVFDPMFRSLCERNSCGNFGVCHMCPPLVGDIDSLILQARSFKEAVLYQTVWPIEDSFDIEGMLEGGRRNNQCAQFVRDALPCGGMLHLSSGGCRVCQRCAARDGLPCLYPDRAMASLEAYGIDVYKSAKNAGLPYSNGPNTVTYFGMILFGEERDA
jgi:predicted metal-binding protein